MKYLLLILSLLSFNTFSNNFSDLNFNGLTYIKKEDINKDYFFKLINLLDQEDTLFRINSSGFNYGDIEIIIENNQNQNNYFSLKDIKTLELFDLNKNKFTKATIISEQIKKLKIEILKKMYDIFESEKNDTNNNLYHFDIVDNNFYGKSMGKDFDSIITKLLIIQRLKRNAPITMEEAHKYIVEKSLSTRLENNYYVCAITIPTEIYKKQNELYPNSYTLFNKSQKTEIVECD